MLRLIRQIGRNTLFGAAQKKVITDVALSCIKSVSHVLNTTEKARGWEITGATTMAGDSDIEEGQWHNGNGYETFVKLMSLEQTGPNSFKSAFPAYSPGGGTRAYGGHVYAQAALAAARTVGEGFVIHVCTSIEQLLPALPGSEHCSSSGIQRLVKSITNHDYYRV